MDRILFRSFGGWLAGAVGILALVASSIGTAVADDEEFPPPVNIRNNTTSPGCLSIIWEHYGSGVHDFSVGLDYGPQIHVGTVGKYDPPSCFDPESRHHVKVCAHYATEEGDEACEEADLETARGGNKVGELDNPQDKPTPPIVAANSDTTWVDLEWGWKAQGPRAGYDYDKYFVWLEPTNGDPLVTHEEGSGNWGYWKFQGLKPDTLYRVQVQGCTESDIPFVEGTCWGKSGWRDVRTKPYPLHSGADTCLPGFVWREAFQGDTVCVPPPRRDAVKADNAQASSRLNFGGNCTPPNCTFTAPDICKQGFVWREIRPEDHVCVSPQERDLVKQENAMANQRRAAPR